MKNNQTLESIMNGFATRTGLTDLSKPSRRYLWTDAFAVCNFLELYRQTKNEHYKEMALLLVDTVHSVLGRYHNEDSREGWISGLDDAKEHPTIGGLRIGKLLMDRAPDEPYDERKEWDRDGQYFHYLTKWMHALSQTASVTAEVKYLRWAIELAKTAHRAFTYELPDRSKRMYWKMSTDLSRPLVTSMGQHDALDAYITYLQLSATASGFGESADLSREIEEAAAMAETMPLETEDPLGLGGLLNDAGRAAQLIAVYGLPLNGLLISLLDAAQNGVEHFVRSETLRYPPEYRLAFRELGLSIGLHGVERVIHLLDEYADKFEQKEAIDEAISRLQKQIALAEAIETFWTLPKHQQSSTWTEHIDINSVMLATSLAPDGFLSI
ncbi:MAG: hypothetical protein WBF77_13720 [Sulfurimonadaceae bacterium]